MIDQDVFKKKRAIAKNLAHYAEPTSGHLRVLARILGCLAPYAPCGSFACPVCGPDLGDEFVGMTSNFMRIHRNNAGKPVLWKYVTFIPFPFLPVRTTLDRSRVPTRLPRLPADVRREIWFKVQKARIRTLIGALDFSYNEDERPHAIAAGKAFQPHWSVHLHGFVPADQITPQVVTALRAMFPRSDEVPKPVDIKDFDGNPRAPAYSMKTRIQRRLTIMGTSWDRNGQPRLARNTRYRPLRPRQEAELRLMLDRMAMRDRLVLVGVKLCENGSKRWFIPSPSLLTALPPKKIIPTNWPSLV